MKIFKGLGFLIFIIVFAIIILTTAFLPIILSLVYGNWLYMAIHWWTGAPLVFEIVIFFIIIKIFFKLKTMDKLEQFKSLFPLKGYITQEIIDKADIMHTKECIGALTLKSAIPEEFRDCITWGDWSGYFRGGLPKITTKDNIHMMNVETPQEVTFILK